MNVPNQQLTDKFWLHEFLVSDNHPREARQLRPTEYHTDCLRLLCESIAQPVRDRFGTVDVSSGFRSTTLNFLVDGEEDSDHMVAAALDFSTRKASLWRVYWWIIRNDLPYRQLIWYRKQKFIHASINLPGRTYKHEHWSTKA